MENKIKTAEPLKDYLKQDEDIKVNSINELIEKVKNYGKS